MTETPESTIKEMVEEYRYAHGLIRVTTQYTYFINGTIDFEQTYQTEGELPDLPRLGATFTVDSTLNELSWYGRGPWESYPDRKSSTVIGRWNSTVDKQYTPYPRPQDNGNHEQVSEIILSDKTENGIRITAIDVPFSFSVLPYSTKQISETSHHCNLVAQDKIFLNKDTAVMGLGNSSCGPGVLKKYTFDKNKKHSLKIRITNL